MVTKWKLDDPETMRKERALKEEAKVRARARVCVCVCVCVSLSHT